MVDAVLVREDIDFAPSRTGAKNEARHQLRIAHAIIVSAVAAVIALRYAIARSLLPLAPPWSRDDGPYWIIAAVNWLNGRGMTNDLTRFTTFDHAEFGAHSIIGYPPLHSLLLVAIAPDASVDSVYLAIWIIEALAFALMGLGAAIVVHRANPKGRVLLAGLAAIAICSIGALQFTGRPESSFWLILSLGCVYWVVTPQPRPWLLGMLLGLLGATQALAAVLVAHAIVLWISIRVKSRAAITEIAIIAAIAVITFLVAVGTFYGTATFLSFMIDASPEQGFWYLSTKALMDANILDYLRPFSSLLFALALIVAVYRIRSTQIKSKALFVGASISLLVFSVFAFGIRPHCTYNLHALAPLALIVLLIASRNSQRIASALAVMMLVPASATAIQLGVLINHYDDGRTITAAREQLHSAMKLMPDDVPVLVDRALWALSAKGEDWNNWAVLGTPKANAVDVGNSLLVVQEVSPFFSLPQLEDGPPASLGNMALGKRHGLWLDCFTRQRTRIFGKAIYYPVAGFSFAIYVPEGAAGPISELAIEGCQMGTAME